MSLYPRESHERNSLVNLSRQWTHITDADGFPLCCNEPQPAPLRNGDDCPLCADIRKCLPDTVVVLHDVEVLPFSEPLEGDEPVRYDNGNLRWDQDVCPLCLGDDIVYIEHIDNGRLCLDAVPCACQ